MNVLVHSENHSANSRLAGLGLDQEEVREVVRRGQLAYMSCTPNHPPMVPGIWAWGETVRALREYLMPRGWARSDENNYSVVIGPTKKVAIAVCTGDEGTGRADAVPSNKAPKGPSTMDAVASNQMSLFPADAVPQPASSVPVGLSGERVTWILLVHRATDEVRCELSLPASFGAEGKIDSWNERILLDPISLDGGLAEIEPPVVPDINVDVKRKA